MFQFPYILIALSAALIPVLLHILNLQKVKSIEFSTLMFLKDVKKSRFRNIRIKNLLLMLIRFFIIVFLVLLFADPILKSYAGKDSNINRNILIYNDSTFSMNAYQDSSTLFLISKNISEKIISTAKSHDEIVNTNDTVNSFNYILNSSNSVISKTSNGINEVYLINDFQKTFFDKANLKTDYPDNTFYYFINTSKINPSNISINNIIINTQIPVPYSKIKMEIIIKNFGVNSSSGNKLILWQEKNKISETLFDLGQNERKLIPFEFTPEGIGNLSFYFEIIPANAADNSFINDDIYKFNLNIPEKYSIGIIKENTSVDYIKTVFDAANKYLNGNIYRYEEIYNLNELDKYDMLFLAEKSLNENEVTLLKSYLNLGRGVFIFPSDNISQINNLGSFSLKPLSLNNQSLKISDINSSNPIFEGLFKNENLNPVNEFSEIKINKYFEITPSSSAASLINFGNSKPMLIEDKSYTGSILISALMLSVSSSDFITNSFFPPLIVKSVSYLSYNIKSETNLPYWNHRDTLESEPERIKRGDLKEVIENAGIKNYKIIEYEEIKNLEQIINENRAGKSYWNYTLILTLLLVSLEIVIIKKYSKSK